MSNKLSRLRSSSLRRAANATPTPSANRRCGKFAGYTSRGKNPGHFRRRVSSHGYRAVLVGVVLKCPRPSRGTRTGGTPHCLFSFFLSSARGGPARVGGIGRTPRIGSNAGNLESVSRHMQIFSNVVIVVAPLAG